MIKDKLYFEINLTDDCNLHCAYCSESLCEKTKSYVSNDIIDRFIKYIQGKTHDYRYIQINFFGGEPLLNKPALYKIVESLIEYSNVHFSIITNGILISEYIDLLIQYKDKFYVQVSYDGNPNHDKNRCNSSKTVKKSIRLLIKNKIHFGLHSVICPEDFNTLYLSYKDICNMKGIEECSFVVEFANKYDEYSREIKDIWISNLNYSLTSILRDEISNKKPKINWFKYYKTGELRAYCSAGIDNYSLNYDGNIYKCHGAIYSNCNSKKHLICSIFDSFNSIDSKLNICSHEHIKNRKYNDDCIKCKTLICYNCHTSNFDNNYSEINTYFDNWNNKNDDFICEIYNTISKYIQAYDVLKTEVK